MLGFIKKKKESSRRSDGPSRSTPSPQSRPALERKESRSSLRATAKNGLTAKEDGSAGHVDGKASPKSSHKSRFAQSMERTAEATYDLSMQAFENGLSEPQQSAVDQEWNPSDTLDTPSSASLQKSQSLHMPVEGQTKAGSTGIILESRPAMRRSRSSQASSSRAPKSTLALLNLNEETLLQTSAAQSHRHEVHISEDNQQKPSSPLSQNSEGSPRSPLGTKSSHDSSDSRSRPRPQKSPSLRQIPPNQIASRFLSTGSDVADDTWRASITEETYRAVLAEHGTRGVKRQELIWELCSTESSFVCGLRTIHRRFCKKARRDYNDASKAPLKVIRLFESFGKILVLHVAFDWCLQNIRESQVPVVEYLAHALLPLVDKIEAPYSAYLTDLSEGCRLIEECIQKQDDFGKFLKQQSLSPEMGSLPLTAHLLKPAQRLMKYPLFFKNILDLMPEDDEDYDATVRLYERTDTVIRRAQENKTRNEWNEEVKSVSSRIRGLPPGFQFVDGQRRLLKEGPMSLITLPDHLDLIHALSLQESGPNNAGTSINTGLHSRTGSSISDTGDNDFFQRKHVRDASFSEASVYTSGSKATDDWNELGELADQFEAWKLGGAEDEGREKVLEGRIGLQDVQIFLFNDLMLVTRKDGGRVLGALSSETQYRLIKPPLEVQQIQPVGNAALLIVIRARPSQLGFMNYEGPPDDLALLFAPPESSRISWMKEWRSARDSAVQIKAKTRRSSFSTQGSSFEPPSAPLDQDDSPRRRRRSSAQPRQDIFAELKAQRQRELLAQESQPAGPLAKEAVDAHKDAEQAVVRPAAEIKSIFFASLGLGGNYNSRRDPTHSSGRRKSSTSSRTIPAR